MTRSFKNYFCAALMAGIFFSFVVPHAHASGTDIQMLPPISLGSSTFPYTPCSLSVSHPSFLAWDGANPINCITSITSDTSGNITINNGLTVNTSPVVANGGVITSDLKLGSTDVTSTILSLTGLACPGYEAVTTNPAIPGTYMCIAVTDVVGVGKTVMPSCPAGQEIYFNGTGFVCETIALPSCPAGTELSYDALGNASCKTILVACSSGQVMAFDGTNVSCQAIPFPAAPVVPAVAPGCNDNFHALRSDASGNIICSPIACYYSGDPSLWGPGVYAPSAPAFITTPRWVLQGQYMSWGQSDGSTDYLTCTDAINNVLTTSGSSAGGSGGGTGGSAPIKPGLAANGCIAAACSRIAYHGPNFLEPVPALNSIL